MIFRQGAACMQRQRSKAPILVPCRPTETASPYLRAALPPHHPIAAIAARTPAGSFSDDQAFN